MPHRRALLAGLGAASASLAGCNYLFGDGEAAQQRQVPGDWTPEPGEWGGPTYDQTNSGYNPHASPPESEPTVDWAVDARTASPLVADGTVFLRDGVKLHGYDAADGSEQFDVSLLNGSLYQYVEGRLYDRNLDGLDALTLEGEPAWDEPIEYEEELAGFVERDGYVFLSTGTDTIHHHDADTGERVDATVLDVTVRGLSNRDGVLYAALADGLVTYDVGDGGTLEERWRHRIDDGSDLEPRFVVVGADRAYLERRRGRSSGPSAVDVFDVAGESRLGTLEFDRGAFVAAVDEYAYVSVARQTGRQPTDGELHAYDGTERVWTVEVKSAPVLAAGGGVLYAALADGLVTYDVGDGGSLEERWRHRIDDGSDLEPRFVVVGADRAYLERRRGRSSGPSAVDVFDVAGESRLGTLEFDRGAFVAAVDEYAYVSVARQTGRQPTDGELRAYDGTERVWTVEVESAPVLAAGGDVLCVGSSDVEAGSSSIVALDAASGDELWTYEGAFPLAVVGETVYATTDDDRFVALRS